MLKAIALFLASAAMLACAAVFEAVTQTEAALDAASAARRASSERIQEPILANAIARMERSWAKPTLWHAEAADALSTLYARLGNARHGDSEAFTQSAAWAARAVRMGPAQPRAWARLAEFSAMGLSTPCNVQACLERSWEAAPLLDERFDCARLRIAYAAGVLAPTSERITSYLRSDYGVEAASACLTFLPETERLQAILRARTPAPSR